MDGIFMPIDGHVWKWCWCCSTMPFDDTVEPEPEPDENMKTFRGTWPLTAPTTHPPTKKNVQLNALTRLKNY